MTRNLRDDEALIATLESVRDAARRCFEHYDNQARLGVWLPHPSPSLEEIAVPVRTAMGTHRIFKQEESRFFGSKQLILGPYCQSNNLIRASVDRNSITAVDWLHEVYDTKQAKLRYVAEVYGLKVTVKVFLSNGVTLVPLEYLPRSANAQAIQSQFQFFPNRLPISLVALPVGAFIEISELPYATVYNDKNTALAPTRSETLEKTIRAFTLVDGAAPVVGTSWLEFVDDHLRMAEFGMKRMMAQNEGLQPFVSVDVDAEAIEWIERYLALLPELGPRCDVAIERLNLARRRLSAGNKAIEGGISLEALLGFDENQEITYRLRLRAALLLSNDVAKRREISKAVNDFYTLRSRTVHGSLDKTKVRQSDDACVARGLEICSDVLKVIVCLNKPFIPADWELSGGQPS